MKQRIVSRHPVLVAPGAVLARSVLRSDGVVLLVAGTELDADKLSHLHQRGVEVVYLTEDDPRDAEAIANEVAAAEARVSQIFAGPTGDIRDELARVVLNYRRAQAA
jgi:hypothetical protein